MEKATQVESKSLSTTQVASSSRRGVKSTDSTAFISDTDTSSSRSIFSRRFPHSTRHPFSLATKTTKPIVNGKGPLGITTVHRPGENCEPTVHIVFIHGLGGGSQHTWTKDGVLWPRDLLSKQAPFVSTAIHLFGYDSDFKRSSTLNIQDFSKSLLNGILNNPVIYESRCPIIFIGHSMGGLVMKRAFIMARQTRSYEEVASRIKAMVFVATPHTGSQLAPILDKIFRLTSGLKPYLEDLTRNSVAVQYINAEFPAQSADLILYSFYETKPLNLGGVRDVMIVPKTDAVLNYPHEQSALLYGDHRSICKFSTADDHNFIVLWQAIAACIRRLGPELPSPVPRPTSYTVGECEDLNRALGISEAPADDLYRLKTEKLPGTCGWLTEDETYRQWYDGDESKVLWVRGSPGSGKSFAAGHIIEVLETSTDPRCYYFFNYGDRRKSSIEGLLLSLAWQMAKIYDDVRKRILELYSKDSAFARSGDYRALHRRLWEQGVLQADLGRSCFWVIDAFDECQAAPDLGKFISRTIEKTKGRIKIMVTSRNSPEDYHISPEWIRERNVTIPDTKTDIATYLDMHRHLIAGSSTQERDTMRQLIIDRSNGCFLWATLVLKRLTKIVGSNARLRALEEMPPGMDQLYSRILASMSQNEESMSRMVLMWASCAMRPLKTTELQFVLENIAMDELDDIDTIVSRYCHDLVYVENSIVKMRHASVRGFLLRHDVNAKFPGVLTIREEEAHKTLAMACLNYLNGPEMKVKPKRKMVASAPQRSAFVEYACEAVHEHIIRTSDLDTDVLEGLAQFFKTNVLSWIEYLAMRTDLETILRFAQALKAFLGRRSMADLLPEDGFILVNAWANDLVGLVSKFGHQLLIHAESIIQLIPPFCPLGSAPFIQFARGNQAAMSVLGLSARSWDDCLCTAVLSKSPIASSRAIVKERLHSVSTSQSQFCLGTSIGRIAIFNEKTCLEEQTVEHGSPVTHLQFSDSDHLLASASKRMVRLWDTETWTSHWDINLRAPCLAMAFVDNDKLLLVALKNNTLLALNLLDRVQTTTTWIDILDGPHRQWYHGFSPQFASFNPDLGLLALGYSCRRVLVYNYDRDTYDIFHHEEGLSDYAEEQSNISLYAMTFSKLPDTSLLVVSYNTAKLVLFDTENGNIQATVSSVFFPRLVSSPDGRTLAGARTDGAIELYDFETLHKLYQIRPDEGAVSALAFTADSTRLLVIRAGGHTCRMWDPATLYRRDVGPDSIRSTSLSSGSQDGVYDQPDNNIALVSALACDANGEFFFVGKEDNSVSIYDTRTGSSIGVLFSHVGPIKSLSFASHGSTHALISVDLGGFLIVHNIKRSGQHWAVEKLYTHEASVTGVQQYLCDKSASRLLVCSNYKATLLTFATGESIATQIEDDIANGESCLWTQHPTDDSLLLCLTGRSVYHYRWSTLEHVSNAAAGFTLDIDLADDLRLITATTLFSQANAVLSMTFAAFGQRGMTTTICFSAPSFAPTSATAKPLLECQAVCDQIQLIIGMFRDRVVFLHRDGWICSAKADGMRGEGEGIMHHFAPPREWLRSNRDPLIRVSKTGDVMVAVKGEVAVVKRGLVRVAHVKSLE